MSFAIINAVTVYCISGESAVLCLVLSRSLFVFCLFHCFVCHSDYPFGVFKLFFLFCLSRSNLKSVFLFLLFLVFCKTNNDLLSTKQRTADWTTRTLHKNRSELRCSGRVGSFCTFSGTPSLKSGQNKTNIGTCFRSVVFPEFIQYPPLIQ
jgi:hypothetical protein